MNEGTLESTAVSTDDGEQFFGKNWRIKCLERG
jgi:hypothetical protein